MWQATGRKGAGYGKKGGRITEVGEGTDLKMTSLSQPTGYTASDKSLLSSFLCSRAARYLLGSVQSSHKAATFS